MSIVSAEKIEDAAQADGRRWVRCRFVDHLARVYFRVWMAEVNEVIDPAQFSAAIQAVLVEAEIQRNLAAIYADGGLASVTVEYATTAQNGAAIREAYRVATREQVWALASFLVTLSDAQLRSLFGLTNGQVAAFRSRLESGAAKWQGYIAAVGE